MARTTLFVGASLAAFFAIACQPPRSAVTRGVAPAASEKSPLAKVKTGMTFEEVVAVLGPPTSQRRQLTGQAFSPLAIGNQAQTTSFHYPKLGRVIFAGPDYRGQNAEVIAVEVDPNESGN
jgi:hypothetical protein